MTEGRRETPTVRSDRTRSLLLTHSTDRAGTWHSELAKKGITRHVKAFYGRKRGCGNRVRGASGVPGKGQTRLSGGDGGETTLATHIERFEDVLAGRKRQLTVEQILAWADAYHVVNGRWPIAAPVPVAGAPGESWDRIDQALRRRERGLSGYSSLARLLAACRGAGNSTGPTRLRIDQILGWADAFHAAHGRWPIAAPVPWPKPPKSRGTGSTRHSAKASGDCRGAPR